MTYTASPFCFRAPGARRCTAGGVAEPAGSGIALAFGIELRTSETARIT